MDLLADVLAVGGVRGTAGARIEAGGTWGMSWQVMGAAAFYAITSGTAWLSLREHEPRQLMPGDVVLLPGGTPHALSSAPGLPTPSCPRCDEAMAHGSVLRLGADEVQTHILGASYEYDPTVSTQVMATLPRVLHIRADNGGTCLDDTVRLLSRELAYPQVATTFVLNRLVDILLVQLLRVWLAQRPDESRGTWLSVLTDPVISVALAKLHQEPARAWTTESLATELTISRSTLTRRFRAVTGAAPADYLTRWRMDLAAVRLRDTDDTLDAIARSVGYTSVYAFSRAFRRSRSQAPGQFRAATRAS
ncbi:AraC family transcriptional regulator [Amycolatopsis sp. 195334CR]|uniref:AraC family transcriptional regulator n=1 Tax=Amycolatopsis sp. 195334CR TaxID=2814588 RepID=UPI001A8F2462|nr:AraC family transcriptional regulator [Amycolatopsis sp. 195334CR]MBN6037368.1 AraC family transcriptional regulator [Amycolatopsis sp. 195334CR]